jgi:hypothetical protein
MKKMITTCFAILAVVFAAPALAQDAELFVIHGIPGLPEPVDVYADGDYLFSFDFNESAGPLALPTGSYFVEVKLQDATVLSADAMLEPGGNYTAIAHLTPPMADKLCLDGDCDTADPGIALSLFENNVSPLDDAKVRITLRHTADAPAVDIKVNHGFRGRELIKPLDLANGDMPGQFGAIDSRQGNLRAVFYPAGDSTAVFDSGEVFLGAGSSYIVYAIGSLTGGSFGLFVQAIDL